ncbi:hypothetical protein [Enterobacter ludwigii]|uniref:hypothetical protein n=1 Tax=Enterobacter ludwigii TaxID=299767 RepID=UPI002A83653D|nr:hypothetical protein [Enterobacter ludwigii]
MSNIDKLAKHALREAAERAKDNFIPSFRAPTRDVLALLDELEAAEKRIAELERKPVWINHRDKTVPAALRYLAENQRPIGGSSSYNTEHLYDLAREIEIAAGTGKGE